MTTVADEERKTINASDNTKNATPHRPHNHHSPLSSDATTTRKQRAIRWITITVAVYLLITSVKLISDGFSLAAGENIHQLFDLVDNVLIAFAVGILATVLTQSSSTTTSITVGLAAAGLPLSAAIPILLGANIGTTVTNTIVALSAPSKSGDKNVFRRSFSAASLHDFFNILAVAIFLPLEIFFGLLEKLSEQSVSIFGIGSENADIVTSGDSGLSLADTFAHALSFPADMLSSLLASELIVNTLGHVLTGLIIITLAVTLLIFSIRYISRQLGCLLVGKTEKALKFAISHNSFAGLFSGFLVTSAVQSSSTSTSLAVPLVGSGSFTLKHIYPFVVGANIGTTLTALLISVTMLGTDHGELAVQAALVHVIFNVLATIIIMLTPGIKNLPLRAAEWAGDFVAQNRMLAIAYVVIMFLVIPVLMLLIGMFL